MENITTHGTAWLSKINTQGTIANFIHTRKFLRDSQIIKLLRLHDMAHCVTSAKIFLATYRAKLQ